MNYNIIAARCLSGGIGFNGKLPWRCKSDLREFSKLTKGNGNNAVVMGRKTWESLPNALKDRTNIILSNKSELPNLPLNAIHFQTPDQIKDFCKIKQFETVWIIGGEVVYKLFITDPIINNLYITEIFENYECDAFFPIIPKNFEVDSSKTWKDDDSGLTCKLNVYNNYYLRS